MKYKLVKRSEFVERRYKNYLKKKKFLDELDPERLFTHLTDLDKTFPDFNKPMKEVVLCDGCNEDIEEVSFIFVEKQRCYHSKCAESFLPSKTILYTVPKESPIDLEEQTGLPPNVIPLFRRKT